MDKPPEISGKWKTVLLHPSDFARSFLSVEFPAEFLILFARIQRWGEAFPFPPWKKSYF